MPPDELDALRRRILAARPGMAGLIDPAHSPSALDHVTRALSYRPAPRFRARIARIAAAIGRAVEPAVRGFGGDVPPGWLDDLVERPVVLTSDHHAIQTFPLLLHGNLLFCLPELLANRDVARVTLAGAFIPMSNRAIGRGGVFFTGARGELHRLPLFSARWEDTPVCAVPAMTTGELHQAWQRALRFGRDHEVAPATLDAIAEVMAMAGSTPVAAEASFEAQASHLNALLWKRLLPTRRTRLLHASMERVATPVLIDALRRPGRDLLATAILDPRWRDELRRAFSGIQGCWKDAVDEGDASGTFLFWALDGGRPVALHEANGHLVGAGVRIQLRAEALVEALASGALQPGTFLKLFTLALHGGFACAGGFNQGTYLATMRDTWTTLLDAHGETAEAAAVATVPAAILTGPAVAFTVEGGRAVPATGIDLLAAGGLSDAHFARLAAHQVSTLLAPQLVEISRAIYGRPDGGDGVEAVAVAGPLDLVVCAPDDPLRIVEQWIPGLFTPGPRAPSQPPLATGGCVFAGFGCVGRGGVSIGLPIDAVTMVIAAELARRAYQQAEVVLLVADQHAVEAGADLGRVAAIATHYKSLLSAISRLLEIPSFAVILASELDRDVSFRGVLDQAKRRGAGHNAYFDREAADIEFLRRHRRLGLKIGWRRSGRSGRNDASGDTLGRPVGTNELAFDRHYLATFPEGDATRFLYVGPGRTLDPARPFVPPYVEPHGEHRIVLRADEQVAAKLARCPASYRDGVLRHYDVLLAGWEALAGPLGGSSTPDRLQALVATLSAAARPCVELLPPLPALRREQPRPA